MAGMTTTNSDILIRSEIWSNQLKDTLRDTLEATKYVRWIDFPDGDTLTIPSLGDLDAYDYTEDTAIEYTPMAMIAVGYQASPDVLDEETKAKELKPRSRKPLETHFFEGGWGHGVKV